MKNGKKVFLPLPILHFSLFIYLTAPGAPGHVLALPLKSVAGILAVLVPTVHVAAGIPLVALLSSLFGARVLSFANGVVVLSPPKIVAMVVSPVTEAKPGQLPPLYVVYPQPEVHKRILVPGTIGVNWATQAVTSH
jgi:hypothetical protein